MSSTREQAIHIATCGEIWKKNKIEFLCIAVKEFRGHKYVDMRKFFQNGAGKLFPDAGFTISAKSIDDVIASLKYARSILSGEKEPF